MTQLVQLRVAACSNDNPPTPLSTDIDSDGGDVLIDFAGACSIRARRGGRHGEHAIGWGPWSFDLDVGAVSSATASDRR